MIPNPRFVHCQKKMSRHMTAHFLWANALGGEEEIRTLARRKPATAFRGAFQG